MMMNMCVLLNSLFPCLSSAYNEDKSGVDGLEKNDQKNI